jgi:hypothetical protein
MAILNMSAPRRDVVLPRAEIFASLIFGLFLADMKAPGARRPGACGGEA